MTTTIITIYSLSSQSEKLFAHCVQTKTPFQRNGVPENAKIVFIAVMFKASRQSIKTFVLSERRWPFPLPIVWDDTNEAW